MKEKRISHVVTRTCINCGSTWEVRERPSKSKVYKPSNRLFCTNCLYSLTLKEKQHLYRLNSGKYHDEERTCLCCGRTWIVEVPNDCKKTRMRMFCNDCINLSQTEKKRIMRDKISDYHEKEKLNKKESNKRNYIHLMVKRAEDRARKYGYEFDLDESEIIIPDKCPILEVPFTLGEKGNYEYTPTIDRVNNSKGYTKDNIQIISKKANSMKNSASLQELKMFCKNILRYSLTNMENEHVELQDKELVG